MNANPKVEVQVNLETGDSILQWPFNLKRNTSWKEEQKLKVMKKEYSLYDVQVALREGHKFQSHSLRNTWEFHINDRKQEP